MPRIYVSLGSFLSARSDVLQRIVSAFAGQPVRLIVAAGVTAPEALGDLPKAWHVEEYLPQPAVLRFCDLAISHGGNNTVTEALWAGVPLLVCPFSTDQFAAAEDVRGSGVGDSFDPNGASVGEIAWRARRVLAGAAPRRAAALGVTLRRTGGPGAREPPRRGSRLERSPVARTLNYSRAVMRLRTWNAVLAVAHAAQGVAILLLANDATIPITWSFIDGPPATGMQQTDTLYDLPFGPAVAAFLFLAAIDHGLMAAPRVVDWYERNLAAEQNPARWWEYSISASLMIVLIAMLTGSATSPR